MRKLFNSMGLQLLILVALSQFMNCSKDDPSTLKIGMSYGGGIIFYLDATKSHGLIASPSDYQTIVVWSQKSVTTNATGIPVGTGRANTNAIVASEGTGSYAAIVCDELVLNGYNDWFLPSREELSYLYNQKVLVGGFGKGNYWSSTESANNTAWGQSFLDGSQNISWGKSGSLFSIRAIRSF
jgi:hypothetical protein